MITVTAKHSTTVGYQHQQIKNAKKKAAVNDLSLQNKKKKEKTGNDVPKPKHPTTYSKLGLEQYV